MQLSFVPSHENVLGASMHGICLGASISIFMGTGQSICELTEGSCVLGEISDVVPWTNGGSCNAQKSRSVRAITRSATSVWSVWGDLHSEHVSGHNIIIIVRMQQAAVLLKHIGCLDEYERVAIAVIDPLVAEQ